MGSVEAALSIAADGGDALCAALLRLERDPCDQWVATVVAELVKDRRRLLAMAARQARIDYSPGGRLYAEVGK